MRQVIGADVTPEMLAEAVALTRKRGVSNVAWHLADAQALPYRDAAFQGVACRRAAHHFSDIRLALSEVWRVLAPGGWLAIDDRSAPEDDAVDAIMHTLDGLHDPSHVRQYRSSVWRTLLNEAGFEAYASQTYKQHRPLTSLTHGVSAADAARIRAIVDEAPPAARELMRLEPREGTLYLNHWYLLLAARKAH